MGLVDNFKEKQFWVEVLKIGVIFFVLFVGISLVISNFSDILSGNFAAIYEKEWADGKWQGDLGVKLAISLVYAVYMVSRRRTFKRSKAQGQ